MREAHSQKPSACGRHAIPLPAQAGGPLAFVLWAGYPNSEAYHPSDIGATIYQALGLDPRTEVRDIQGRPVIVNQGSVMERLF